MIGIVGGMGPYAGIDLIKKIFDQTAAARDQDYLPVAMLSVPEKIPDRTDFLSGKTKENPGKPIARIINSLIEMGAELIGIACNTAHAEPIFNCIVENLKNKEDSSKIVHMIEEVALYLKQNLKGVKKVGILSTSGTLLSNIYPKTLANFGIETLQLPDEIQRKFVSPAVYDPQFGIKAQPEPVSEKAESYLRIALSHLIEKEVEAVVLGCTEIPLAIREKEIDGLPVIDSAAVLAAALVKKAAPSKLKDSTI